MPVKQYIKDFWNKELMLALDDLGKSKNKWRALVKHKKAIFIVLLVLTSFVGFIGYLKSPDSTGLEIVNNTIGLFIFAWADDDNWVLDIAKFMALFTMSLGAILLYLSKRVDAYEIDRIQDKPYTLLIGLGEQNRIFLNQLPKNSTDVLVIESDSNNSRIEEVKAKGFGVIVSKAEEALGEIDLKHLKECIVSTGNDRQNIAIGLLLMEKLDNKHQRLFVRIENRDLSILFKQQVIQSKNNVDIITYSLYENMTKALFAKHTVLGLQPEIAKENKEFSTIVVGSSPLAVEIVYALSMLSTLPNENRFVLYLVSPDATAFYAKLQKLFTNIDKIPHLDIRCRELSYDDIAFYRDEVWDSKNLTNVIIATEDEERNLDIAINLQDTTYLDKSAKGTLKTKVLFALYHDLGLGKEIDQNKESFANFYSFASMDEACSPENLIDEKLDLLAKLTHNDYTGSENIKMNSMNKNWMALSVYKKESNKTQALHIDTKLVALGLKKEKSDKPFQELIKTNETLMEKRIPQEERSEQFPEKFDTFLSKLAKAEHNRWNAYHYLNGWEYDANRDDKVKRHNCLLPLSEFSTNEQKGTYKYDVKSVLNIPTFLAHAGYELVYLERR